MEELHHEAHDGRGYPYGLTGDQVPLAVRIVHVADVYDVLTTNRPYPSAMPERRVRDILALHAGSQFDPEVVRVFLSILIPETSTGLDLEPLARVTKA